MSERPEIPALLEEYVKAFGILSSFRDMNGNLILENIFSYARQIEEDPMEFLDIIMCVENRFSGSKNDLEMPTETGTENG